MIMPSINTFWLVLGLFCVCAVQVHSQVDGAFWWNNKDLLQKASESRNNKNVDFKSEAVTTDQPIANASDADCTCVHQCKCQVAFESTRTSQNG